MRTKSKALCNWFLFWKLCHTRKDNKNAVVVWLLYGCCMVVIWLLYGCHIMFLRHFFPARRLLMVLRHRQPVMSAKGSGCSRMSRDKCYNTSYWQMPPRAMLLRLARLQAPLHRCTLSVLSIRLLREHGLAQRACDLPIKLRLPTEGRIIDPTV